MKIARNCLVLLVFCGLFLCARPAFAALGTLTSLHQPIPQEQGLRLRQRVLDQEAERLLAQIRILDPEYRGSGDLQRLSEDYQRIRRTMILEIVGFTGFGYPAEAPDRQLLRDYTVMLCVKHEGERRFLAGAAQTTPNRQAPLPGTQEAQPAGEAAEPLTVASAEPIPTELVTGHGENPEETAPLPLSDARSSMMSAPAVAPAATGHSGQSHMLPEIANAFHEIFTRFGVPAKTPCLNALFNMDTTPPGEAPSPRRTTVQVHLAVRLPH